MNKAELIKALAEMLAEKMQLGEEPTNGEVIKALFPQSYFLNDFPFCGSSLEKVYFDDKKSNLSCIMTNEEWWNAPYKKGGE